MREPYSTLNIASKSNLRVGAKSSWRLSKTLKYFMNILLSISRASRNLQMKRQMMGLGDAMESKSLTVDAKVGRKISKVIWAPCAGGVLK